MEISFWSATSLPMYGTKVGELHLDINGKHYVVRADSDGEPVLASLDRAEALAELQQQYPDGVTRSPDA